MLIVRKRNFSISLLNAALCPCYYTCRVRLCTRGLKHIPCPIKPHLPGLLIHRAPSNNYLFLTMSAAASYSRKLTILQKKFVPYVTEFPWFRKAPVFSYAVICIISFALPCARPFSRLLNPRQTINTEQGEQHHDQP